MPAGAEEFAVQELGLVLAEGRGAAEDLLTCALALEARLPGTKAALRDGIITRGKAQVIIYATALLDAAESRRAEELVLGREGMQAARRQPVSAATARGSSAQHDLAPPEWAELRVLQRPWFPAELKVQRADALVRAPAEFRKHGVYLSAADLEAA